MKKNLIASLLALSFMLAGCGMGEGSGESSPQGPSSSEGQEDASSSGGASESTAPEVAYSEIAEDDFLAWVDGFNSQEVQEEVMANLSTYYLRSVESGVGRKGDEILYSPAASERRYAFDLDEEDGFYGQYASDGGVMNMVIEKDGSGNYVCTYDDGTQSESSYQNIWVGVGSIGNLARVRSSYPLLENATEAFYRGDDGSYKVVGEMEGILLGTNSFTDETVTPEVKVGCTATIKGYTVVYHSFGYITELEYDIDGTCDQEGYSWDCQWAYSGVINEEIDRSLFAIA